jgi:uncharacterized protein (UPF0147 family)
MILVKLKNIIESNPKKIRKQKKKIKNKLKKEKKKPSKSR